MKREPSSPRLAKPSYRNRDPSLADQTHRVLFSLPAPFRFVLRVEPRAEKTRVVHPRRTLFRNFDQHRPIDFQSRERRFRVFQSKVWVIRSNFRVQTVRRDIGSRDSMPRPDHRSRSMQKLRNEFALRSSKRIALACLYLDRFVKRRCAVTDRIVLPLRRFPCITISMEQAREEAVVRVAGSFGRDKQPRGLKGFRVMYARGGYLGLGTREEKTNERMDATGLRADSLDVFSLPFVFSRVPSPSLFGRWKIRGEYAK